MQLAAPHTTLLPATKPAQVLGSFAPSHVRALQTSLPASHFARTPWGPPSTGEQVPTFPTRSHASHCPSHVVSQQTASTQCAEPHSASTSHGVAGFFAHTPLPSAQEAPSAQSATPQQTPSVQNPLAQVAALVQASPSPGAGTHAPVLQRNPGAQSLPLLQLALQALAPQA